MQQVMELTGLGKDDPLYPVMDALDEFYSLIEQVPLELSAEREVMANLLGRIAVLCEAFLAVAESLERKLDTSTPKALTRGGIRPKELVLAVLIALAVGTCFGQPAIRVTLRSICQAAPTLCEPKR